MTKAAPLDRRNAHADLVREIDAHNYRYYVLDDASVTDAAFDALLREVRAIEAEHPELATPDSPTQRVGGEPRATTSKVKHAVRMLSLDNAYSADDLSEFARRVREGLPDADTPSFCVEPKLDGGSVEAIYEGGRLVEASTRGDGEVGEEITVNLRVVNGLPARIAHEGRITLRGEVLLFRKDLEALNVEREAAGEEPFMNARNAAAGSVRMLDPREVAKRNLRVVFYQLVEGPSLHASHSASLEWLASQGLPTHRRHVLVAGDGVAPAIDAVDRARASYPFDTDGAVVKVDSYRHQEILGQTSKFPKWAVAYKFAPEQVATTMREIIVQVGRTGALTPVAVLDPVELGGTTVSRASLHNSDMVSQLDMRIGDRVLIQKAGEVIPQVIGVVDKAARRGDEAPFEFPRACPVCGTTVVRTEGEAATRCPNRTCPAQVKGQIFYFARRFAMDVDHLGISLVEHLVDTGLVRDVADLYALTPQKIAALERMGDKSAQNVHDSIQRSKSRTLDRLLCGLGIPQIGQVAAKQLAEEAHTLERVLAWSEAEVREHVDAIRGFGPKMVESVVQFLLDPEQRRLLMKLHELGVGAPQPIAVVAAEGPLKGKCVCVTGVLSKKREDVHADIRAAGGEVHDGVKKNTSYLVAGEKTGKSKLDQAKKLGTKVVTEAELYALLAASS